MESFSETILMRNFDYYHEVQPQTSFYYEKATEVVKQQKIFSQKCVWHDEFNTYTNYFRFQDIEVGV